MVIAFILFYIPLFGSICADASPASDWWNTVSSGKQSDLCVFGADTVYQTDAASGMLKGTYGWAVLQQLPVDATLSAQLANGSLDLHYSGHVTLQGLFYFNDSAGSGTGDVFAESIVLKGSLNAPNDVIANLTVAHVLPAGVYTFTGTIELTNYRSIVDLRAGMCGRDIPSLPPAPTPNSNASMEPSQTLSTQQVSGEVLLVLLIVCGLAGAALGLLCWLSLADARRDEKIR